MGILDFFLKKDDRDADFSNVRSGGRSTSPRADDREEREEKVSRPPTHVYEVRKGDSLSAIALRVYGDATLWTEIYEANRDRIKDPDLIYPGQKLEIPDRANGVPARS